MNKNPYLLDPGQPIRSGNNAGYSGIDVLVRWVLAAVWFGMMVFLAIGLLRLIVDALGF